MPDMKNIGLPSGMMQRLKSDRKREEELREMMRRPTRYHWRHARQRAAKAAARPRPEGRTRHQRRRAEKANTT